jgi:hypothetical protein
VTSKDDSVSIRRQAANSRGFQAALPTDSLASILDAQTGITDSIAAMMPKIDIANIPGMAEMSRNLAAQNARWIASIQPVFPKIDIPNLAGFVAPAWLDGLHEIVSAQISGVLSGIDWDEMRRLTLIPANWPTNFEEYLPAIQAMLNAGVPLAWVPRRELFLLLVTASNAEERLEILCQHRAAVLEDCAQIVDGLEDDFMAAQIPLAREVIAACRDGHWRVAAAAAVDIVNAIVEHLEWSTNPQGLTKNHRFTPPSTPDELIEPATRAPLVSFYKEWHPKSGKPQPSGLSRHMVSHNVTDKHLDEHNCVVAVMLMASLMETVNQLELGRNRTEAA